jgi:hypothetical protein
MDDDARDQIRVVCHLWLLTNHFEVYRVAITEKLINIYR